MEIPSGRNLRKKQPARPPLAKAGTPLRRTRTSPSRIKRASHTVADNALSREGTISVLEELPDNNTHAADSLEDFGAMKVILQHHNGMPKSPSSENVNRLALVETLAIFYFGREAKPSIYHKAAVSFWSRPQTRTTQVSTDAISWLSAASMSADPAALRKGQIVLLDVVQRIKFFLQKLPTSYDNIFGAAHTVMFCEIFKDTSSGPSAWRVHLDGLNAVLGPNDARARPSSQHRFMLRTQLSHLKLIRALIDRRRIAADVPRPSVLMVPMPEPGNVRFLLQLAYHLPELLDHATKARVQMQPSIIHVRIRTACLQHQLDLWLADYKKMQQRSSNTKKRSLIPGEIGPGLCPSRIESHLTGSNGFASAIDGLTYALFWTCMLLVREAIHYTDGHDHGTAIRNCECSRDIDECADLLLDCLPYLWQSQNGILGKAFAIRAPVHFATEWYRQAENALKSQACQVAEKCYRDQVPFIEWDALLPWSFLPLAHSTGLDPGAGDP